MLTHLQNLYVKIQKIIEKIVMLIKLYGFTFGINLIGLYRQQEAAALWNIALNGVLSNNKYIRQNGEIINTVNDIADETLQEKVKQKLIKQIKKQDALGIEFFPKSKLAKKILSSDEMKQFFHTNKDELLKMNKLSDRALSFKLGDLKNSLHNVDLVDIKIDDNGLLKLKVLDTYDFNPNESDWKVRLAREFQEKEYIKTYY